MVRKMTAWLAVLLGIIMCCAFSLAETGIVRDEDGGIWNYDTGIYTSPEGVSVKITYDDEEESSGSSSGSSSESTSSGNTSGGITVTDSSGIPMNEDGSITVISGQYGTGDDSSSGGGGLTQEEWEARMKKALERNGTYTETYYFGPEKDPIPAEVLYMGLARSMIRIGETEMLVNTCDLAWSTEAPASQVLAVIDANRVGYATLRANTSTKAFVLDHCITGKIVRVLSTGKNWCKVDYDGMRGYVLTSALKFFPNVIRSYETGLISLDGRTTGKSTINIRANAKAGSRILGDYVLGTPLTIFSRDDKWCEVDVAGWHCYILTEYVTMLDAGTAMTANNT